MAWFKKEKSPLAVTREEDKTVRTEGLFTKCENCRGIIWKKDLDANDQVCPKCNYHFKIGALARLGLLFDEGAFQTLDDNLVSPGSSPVRRSPALCAETSSGAALHESERRRRERVRASWEDGLL